MIRFLFIGNWKFHEICFDEAIELAVHDGVDIVCFVVRAVVLHALVVEDVRADLRAHSIFFLPASIFACASKRFFMARS